MKKSILIACFSCLLGLGIGYSVKPQIDYKAWSVEYMKMMGEHEIEFSEVRLYNQQHVVGKYPITSALTYIDDTPVRTYRFANFNDENPNWGVVEGKVNGLNITMYLQWQNP